MTVVLSDGDLIRNLLGRYCERIDAGDFAGVGALFAHGALCTEDGHELARGSAAVEAFYAAGTVLHAGRPGTKHLVVDTILEPVSDDAVTARSSYVVLQGVEGVPLQPIITGRYVDRFERVAEAWCFIERRFGVDQIGDLSRHLQRNVPRS